MHQNRQSVKEAFDRWSHGQGSILDLMSEEGVIVVPGTAPHCGSMSKRKFVEEVATPFMSRFRKPPVPLPSRIVADGDDVMVVAEAEGITLDGRSYRNDYVFVLEFRNARLVKATEFLDMLVFNVVWDSIAPGAEAADSMEQPQ